MRAAASRASLIVVAGLTMGAALSLAPAGCVLDVALGGKACDDLHACVDGFVCSSGRCVTGGLDAGVGPAEAEAEGEGDTQDAGDDDAGSARDAGGGQADAGLGPDGGQPDGGFGQSDGGQPDGGQPVDAGIPADWFDAAFKHRVRLTFANSGRAETFVDFPALVRLTPARVDPALMRSDGADLRFVDDDNQTVLAHEIESFAGGTAALWARVPAIDASSATDHVWLYFGDPSATSVEAAATVWSDYALVLHMQAVRDSSPSGIALNDIATTAAAGVIAGARQFNGTSARIAAGSPATMQSWFAGRATFSAWVSLDGFGENGFGRVVDRANDLAGTGGFALATPSSGFFFVHGFSTARGGWRPGAALDLGPWHQIYVEYDNSSTANNAVAFVDGVLASTVRTETPTGAASNDPTAGLAFGAAAVGTARFFNGRIDEVRFSKTARSTLWLDAEHAMIADDAFVQFGAVESIP